MGTNEYHRKVNNRLRAGIYIIAVCLVLMAGSTVFAESKSQPETTQLATPQTTLTKTDLDEIQRIVDETIGNKTRPLIREIAKLGQEKEAGFKEIVGGIGYIFGLVGIVLFFLSRKEGK